MKGGDLVRYSSTSTPGSILGIVVEDPCREGASDFWDPPPTYVFIFEGRFAGGIYDFLETQLELVSTA